MTCIAGVVRDGEVWLGCDSYQQSCNTALTRLEPKVQRLVVPDGGDMLVGGCGVDRVLQLVHYKLAVPPFSGTVASYLSCDFVDALRGCLSSSGYLAKCDGIEGSGETGLLIAFRGELVVISSDFSLERCTRPYRAIGSGDEAAMGAMYAHRHDDPEMMLTVGMNAAAELVATVRGPFHVEKL